MVKNYWGDELPDYVEMPEGADPRENYGRIDFERLPNTRDLGGLAAAEHSRIKPGVLLRSGALYFASDTDRERLRDCYNLQLVSDFRNAMELSELPDLMECFPGARFVHAEIFSDEQQGITQEQHQQALRSLKESEESGDPRAFMATMYPAIVMGEHGIEGYRAFVRALLELEDGAALWHCHVGRDRCGMGTVLVETMLGVSREDMINDYLATNLFAPAEMSINGPACMQSFEAAERAVAEFGGFMGYINRVLGVSLAEIETFRERYLS